jgi:hypothetical protein
LIQVDRLRRSPESLPMSAAVSEGTRYSNCPNGVELVRVV